MSTDRLSKLEQQREALNQKIRREKTRLQGAERRKDTRRKILDGSLLQEMARKDSAFKARVEKEREAWLTRPDDRALFDLPPKEGGSRKEESNAGKAASLPFDSKASA
ncbi:MAG: mobilization protein [bacterium]|nr:mobilization protein [bacterium]